MKYNRKYKVNLEEIHNKHLEGYSLPELSLEYKIPRTTLNRYLREEGLAIYFNRHQGRISSAKARGNKKEFVCVTSWRRTLIEERGHKCQLCDYSKIVDCHHIVFKSQGGRSTRENGILLCPKHHAEVHAGLLDAQELSKLNEIVSVIDASSQIKRKCDGERRLRRNEE